MKTSDVYTVESNAFPNAVVEVATAVPAFIGYTEMASVGGKPLFGKPLRIASMAEYEHCFGGMAQPHFTVKRVAEAAAAGEAPTPPALAAASIAAVPADPDMVEARGQTSVFKCGDRIYVLQRGPGRSGGRFLMHLAMQHFFDNGGGPCYVVSVGDFKSDIAAGDDDSGLIGGIARLREEPEPTLVVVPDAMLLSRDDCVRVQRAVLAHCGHEMRNRFAILDVWGGDLDRRSPVGDCIDAFRKDIGIGFLGFAAAYYPWLHTSLVQAVDLDDRIIDNAFDLAALIKDELQLPDVADKDDRKTAQMLEALADLRKDSAEIEPDRSLRTQTLTAMSELFATLMDEARAQLNLVPPAAAMAGLYTMVDDTRGVWKAPANVSVAKVLRPAVEILPDDQEDLNVATQGKSVNAMRSFIGEGTLVWGARTLDGSSLDWRYINVRRTMIMLEESCRLVAGAMVCEPNTASTWVTLKTMIGNFLTGIWQRGGLAGAVPDDAFSVHVGLGETMTPEDILEGILRVTVLVAVTRPAEFIEITFQQQMLGPEA